MPASTTSWASISGGTSDLGALRFFARMVWNSQTYALAHMLLWRSVLNLFLPGSPPGLKESRQQVDSDPNEPRADDLAPMLVFKGHDTLLFSITSSARIGERKTDFPSSVKFYPYCGNLGADYPKGWPFPTERLAISTFSVAQVQVRAKPHAMPLVLRMNASNREREDYSPSSEKDRSLERVKTALADVLRPVF